MNESLIIKWKEDDSMKIEKYCYEGQHEGQNSNRDADLNIGLQYYEISNDLKPLVLLHAQAVDSTSFFNVMPKLVRYFHVYAVDYYGHGGSLHDASKYNVVDIGNAIIDFIQHVVGKPVCLLGHSSGGLIAAYVASHSDLCYKLILEDPPFFSCQGERRKNTFNYVDLSTICHEFLNQNENTLDQNENTLNQSKETDFVLYYFSHQRIWDFFPEKSREKIRTKLIASATKYRKKHPDKNLKVPFWPKSGLAAYQGMNNYDPRFGEAFYTDMFHAGIDHENLLRGIHCKTLFLKAKTAIGQDGLLMAALSEEDLQHVLELIPDCTLIRFDCGHAIHVEKPKEFVRICKEEIE